MSFLNDVAPLICDCCARFVSQERWAFRKAAFSALYIFERIGLEDAKSIQRDAAFMIGSRESRYCAEAVIRMER